MIAKLAESELLIASTNPGKIEEMKSLLHGLQGWKLRFPLEMSINLNVAENGNTYAENAQLKASRYAQSSGLPTIADDSGLEVEALNGEPGLFSARFAAKSGASAADNRAFLLSQLGGKPQPWNAAFVSTLCLALPSGKEYYAQGRCEGEIIERARGQMGFGYDSIFLVKGLGKTMAELSMLEKNQLSHRAKAMQKLRGILLSGLEND